MNKLNELKEKKLDNKGFSLVELIIVIAIMAVLIGVLAPTYLRYVEKSRRSADLDSIESMVSAVEIYLSDPDTQTDIGTNTTATITAGGTNTAVTPDANVADKALKYAGINNNPTMKSQEFGTYTLTWTRTSATGTNAGQWTLAITNNTTLAAALGR